MKPIYIILIIIVLAVLGGGIYAWQELKSNLLPKNELAEKDVIDNFVDKWQTIQNDIPFAPVLGSIRWNSPYAFQFLGSNKVLIEFDDGHVVIASVFQYGNNYFKHIASFSDLNGWKAWIEKNRIDAPAGVYVRSIVQNGQIIHFNDWALLSPSDARIWLTVNQ